MKLTFEQTHNLIVQYHKEAEDFGRLANSAMKAEPTASAVFMVAGSMFRMRAAELLAAIKSDEEVSNAGGGRTL